MKIIRNSKKNGKTTLSGLMKFCTSCDEPYGPLTEEMLRTAINRVRSAGIYHVVQFPVDVIHTPWRPIDIITE